MDDEEINREAIKTAQEKWDEFVAESEKRITSVEMKHKIAQTVHEDLGKKEAVVLSHLFQTVDDVYDANKVSNSLAYR